MEVRYTFPFLARTPAAIPSSGPLNPSAKILELSAFPAPLESQSNWTRSEFCAFFARSTFGSPFRIARNASKSLLESSASSQSMCARMSLTPAWSLKVSATYQRPFSSVVNATGFARRGSAAHKRRLSSGMTLKLLMEFSASGEASAIFGTNPPCLATSTWRSSPACSRLGRRMLAMTDENCLRFIGGCASMVRERG